MLQLVTLFETNQCLRVSRFQSESLPYQFISFVTRIRFYYFSLMCSYYNLDSKVFCGQRISIPMETSIPVLDDKIVLTENLNTTGCWHFVLNLQYTARNGVTAAHVST